MFIVQVVLVLKTYSPELIKPETEHIDNSEKLKENEEQEPIESSVEEVEEVKKNRKTMV